MRARAQQRAQQMCAVIYHVPEGPTWTIVLGFRDLLFLNDKHNCFFHMKTKQDL